MTRLARTIAREGSFYAAVITLVTFAAFPFYWMLITTFKADGDLYNLKSNPYWFNAAPTLEHLKYLFEDTLFVQWLGNTALIGACVVAITLAVAVPAGYSLARTPGRSGENLGIGIFLTYLCRPRCCFCRCRAWSRISDCRTRSGRWSWCIRPSRSRSAPGY